MVSIQHRRISCLSLGKCAFLLVVIDSFFLPYFRFISMGITVPIIVLWSLLHFSTDIRSKEYKYILLIVLLMMISTGLSIVYSGQVRWETSLSTSIKRTVQYIVSLGLYLFLKWNYTRRTINTENIVYLFVLFIAAFAVIYFLFPRQYASLKLLVSPVDNHTRRFLNNEVVYRFNYLWTDPNNVAYMMAGLETWIIVREGFSLRRKILCLVLSLLVIGLTNSNGGLICLVATNAFAFLFANERKLIHCNIKKIATIMGAIILGILILRFTSIWDNVVMPTYKAIQIRLSGYQMNNDLSGGRLEDFRKSLQYFNPLFFIIGSGKEGFTYENGHLYFICMYGLITYVLFVRLLFIKFKEQKKIDYLWMFPFFVGFTMNIAIGEYKYLSIYILLLTEARYHNYRNQIMLGIV